LVPKTPIDDPDWEQLLEVLTQYLIQKYDEARFKNYWEIFCRQILITGTSVLALPWRYDAINTFRNRLRTTKGKKEYVPEQTTKVVQNGFDFEVVDMLDFYIDPSCNDMRKANVIRRVVKRKGDVIRLIEQGVYPLAEKGDIMNCEAYAPSSRSSTNKEVITYMTGLDSAYQINNQLVALYEFWGNLQIGDYEFVDVCATIAGDKLIAIQPNPYWGGRPFVIGTLVDTHDSPYGIGLLQPVLGQLHAMFEIQNHRLDVDELTINPTVLAVNDGSIDLQNFYVEPGRVIPVEDPESAIVPLQLPNQTQVSVQDESLLEQRVDKTTGVGSYVGVNGGRQAERVTAEEVIAQRDAGGNRLGGYYAHLEGTALMDFLTKSYQYLQQFVVNDETIRIKKQVKESFSSKFDYFSVGQEELQHELDIVPVGSDFLVNKEYELQQRLDFYTFVSQYPELAQFINWQEAIKDMARRFLKQDWSNFIMMPQEQPAPVPGEGQLAVDAMGAQQMPPEMAGAMPPTEGGSGNADVDAYIQSLSQDPKRAMEVVQGSINANQSMPTL
jgi:hypothetical protein